MDVVNFWVVYNTDDMLGQVESFLPSLPGSLRTHQEPSPDVQGRIFKEDDAGWKLRSLYRRMEDLSDIVTLREDLQWLQSTYPANFYCAGMWSYRTGQPIGGVGSPWFQTPPDVANFMPDGTIKDTFLMAGQGARKFI